MSNIRNRFRKLKKYTAWFTLCLYLLQPCLAAAADVVADANAAKNKQPIVDKTANGITIVHIATPSETGISHNYYQQFNVDSRGLILNNARVITQTQLAGYIAGNPNLSGGSARLILNEVTGTGRSYLRGYTEIAGAKADLILANPNGIVGNGFGFINAGRTTLTTGTPLFGGSGSLEAFRVTGGQISVAGSGLDGSRADRVDLISQSVQVNAGMWAKKLNVITGNNKVDYNNLDVQKINDAKTTVALDVGQLGGMYAGKISLIGTAQGVGVNSLGTISALNDDLMINQTGKIIMAGSTSAIGNVVLTSNDNIMNQGSLGSRQSTTINAQGMLINTGILTAGQNMNIIADAAQSSGTIGSGIQTDGSVGNTGDLTLRVNKTASINGQNIAAGNLTVQGAALDIAGGKSSAGLDIGLLASAGDINHTGGTLQTNNKVTITTTGALINDQAINGMAGQITARQMSIAAGNISNHGGRIVQTGTDDTHITSQADLDNTQGTILTKGALNIQAQGEFLNQQGSMQADKNLFVAAQTVNNTKGSLLSLDNSDLTVQTTQAIDNTAGTIGGNGNVNLTSTGLKNAVGQVISGGSLTAAVTGNIDNKDGKLAANQDITLTAQTIQGGGSAKAGRDMNLTASKTIHHLVGGDFAANRNVTIVADTVTSEGSITGVHNVTVTAAAITNASGAKLAGGNTVNLTSNSMLRNQGQISGSALNMTAQTIENNGAVATDALTLTADTITNDGSNAKIITNQVADITANTALNNTNGALLYNLAGNGALTVKTNALTNSGSLLSGKDSNITAGSVSSTGTIGAGIQKDGSLGQAGNLTITAANAIQASGKNLAGGNAQLTATKGDIDHTGAILQANGIVIMNAAGTVKNDKNANGTAGQITGEQVTFTAQAISNRGGSIQQRGAKDTTLTSQSSVDNTGGTILTNGALTLEAGKSLINQQGLLQTGKNLRVQAQSVLNQNGSLLSLDNSGLTVQTTQAIDNTAGRIGGNGNVNLTSTELKNVAGQVISGDSLTAAITGNVDNKDGKLAANQDITLTAQTIQGGGSAKAGRDMNLTASKTIHHLAGGDFAANRNVTIAADTVTSEGSITGVHNVTVTAAAITNASGAKLAGGNTVNLTSNSMLRNQGQISGSTLNMTAQTIENNGAVAADALTMTADTITNDGSNAKIITNQVADITANTTLNNTNGALLYNLAGSGALTVKTNALTNSGSLLSGKDSNITAGSVSSTGTIGAGIQKDGSLGQAGNLTITAANAIQASGKNLAGGNLTVTGTAIDQSGATTAVGGNAQLTATKGDIDHTGAILQANGVVTMNAAGTVKNDKNANGTAGQITGEQVTLTAQAISNRGGSIQQSGAKDTTLTSQSSVDNTDGTILTNGALNLEAGKSLINQQGLLQTGKNLHVQAQSVLNQNGSLLSLDNSGLTVQTTQVIDNTAGTIGGNGNANLTSTELKNAAGQVISGGSLTAAITGNVDNTNGKITAQQDISIGSSASSGAISNKAGSISTGKNLLIRANRIDNKDGKLAANQDITLTAQTIQGGGSAQAGRDINLTASKTIHHLAGGDFAANRNVTIAADTVTSEGSITGVHNVTVTAAAITNASGAKLAGGNTVNLTSNSMLRNQGQISGSALNMTAQTIENNGAVAADALTLTADTITNDGSNAKIITNQVADITANTTLNNMNGALLYNLAGSGALTVKTNALTNSGSLLSGKDSNITAGSVSSTGTIGAGIQKDGSLSQAGNLTITAANAILASGKNLAGGNLTLTGTAIDQSGATTAVGGNAQLTATKGDIDHTGAILQANGVVTMNAAGAVKNDKNANGTAGQITGEQVTLTAQAISNRGGSIQQSGTNDMKLTSQGSLDNTSGTLLTNGQLYLNTGNLSNQNGLIAAQNQAGVTSQGTVDNTNGRLYAGSLSVVASGDVLNSNGKMQAGNGAVISGQNINNANGSITHTGTTGALSITANQHLNNQAGLLGSNGNLAITAGSVDNANNHMVAQNNLTMAVHSDFTNQGNLEANGILSLSAPNLSNTASGTINAGQANLIVGGDITNDGRIEGNQLTTASQNLTNHATIIGNTVTLSAGNITNQGASAIIGGTDTINFWTSNHLINQDGANILSLGNVNIAANNQQAGNELFVNRTQLVTNKAATIEADGNLNLAAENVENLAGGDPVLGTTTSETSKVLTMAPHVIYTSLKENLPKRRRGPKQFGGPGQWGNRNNGYYLKLSITVPQSNVISYDASQKKLIYNDITSTYQGNSNRGEDIGSVSVPTWTGKEAGKTTAYCQSIQTNANGDYVISFYPGYDPNTQLSPESTRTMDTYHSKGSPEEKRTTNTTIETEHIISSPTLGQIRVGQNMGVNVGGQFTNQYSQVAVGNGIIGNIGTLLNQGYRLKQTATSTDQSFFHDWFVTGGGLKGPRLKDSSGTKTFGPYTATNYIDGGISATFTAKTISVTGNNVSNIEQRDGTTGSQIGSTITLPSIGGVAVSGSAQPTVTGKIALNASAGELGTAAQTIIQSGTNPVTQGGTAISGTTFAGATPSAGITAGQLSTPALIAVQSGTAPVTQGGTAISGTTFAGTTPSASITAGQLNTPALIAVQSGTVPAAQGGTAISGTTFAGTAPSTSITSGQLSTPVLTAVQSGTAPAAANGSVAATVSKGDGAVSFTIPQSGLYKMDSKPTAKYVVETDSRFANYKSFISSDYMLQRLNYDPAMTQKRLGDAFYEQKLVNDQITQMTGRRYLSGFDNSDAEYKALMDSGVAQAKSMNLVTGMELTAAQAANLTQDLVWMVEREVTLADGTKEKVLVPQIYLCKASTIDLKSSGALIAADTVDFKLSGNLTNSGTITGSVLTSIQANNLLNQNGGKIGGTGTTSLVAVNDILNQSGTITGGQVFVAAGRDIRNETTSSAVTASTSANGHSWTGSNTVIGAKATIESQGDLTLLAGRDISLQGGAITAVGNAAINAGHDFIVGTVVSQNKGADKSSNQAFSYTDIQNVTSTLSGNNVAVASQGDIRLSGVKVNALSGLSVAAQGNLVVNAVKDIHTENETYNERGDHYNAHSIDETVVGSNLQAGKNATVAALNSAADKGNISITGSSVTSQNGVITIAAAKTVDIQNDMEKHESLKELHSSGHGFFSSTSDSRDYSLLNQVKGSTVSGDQVNIQSGKDIIVHGSNVVGTNDVNLAAQDNINITSAQQTGKEDHYYHETSSGIFSGGVGFTIGKRSITTTDAQQNITQVASTVGSTNGNVNIAAGNDVKVIASDIISGKDTNVLGKNVTIESANNSNQEQQTYKFSQSGISVSVGNQTLNNINSVYQPLTRSTQVEDSRLKALYGYKAATAANNVLNGKTPDGTKAASKDNSLKVSVSIGTSKQQSETDAAQVTVQQSTITAGGNVNVIAAGSGKKDAEGKAVDGDITIVGSNVKGQDISLTAARDVNLKSAENTTNTKTTNSSSSAGVGVEMSAKSAPGFFASGSKANTDGNGNTITQTDTSVTAANTLTIKAGQDINLVGAQAKGETVKVEAGRNLNLESQQAVDNYKETSSSYGGTITVGAGAGITGSASKGKINSNYQSVTQQAEIHAGQGGFNIEVGKNTDLKGAVISSDATPDKNKLSTDTLSYSDIKNKADYSASSIGVNVNTPKGAKLNQQGVTPSVGVPAKGDASSTTKSAVANGTIEVRSNPKQDLSGLIRDTNQSLNQLGKIFDKKKIGEQQELAKLFGEEAYNQIHNISKKYQEKAQNYKNIADAYRSQATKAFIAGDYLKMSQLMNYTNQYDEKYNSIMKDWSEGGTAKTALHGLVGGIMSGITGSGFSSGAIGAGFNESIQKQLSKIKRSDLQQWASAVVGVTAANLLGKDGQAGGSAAVSGTKNNLQAGDIVKRDNVYYWVAENGKHYAFINGVDPGTIVKVVIDGEEYTVIANDPANEGSDSYNAAPSFFEKARDAWLRPHADWSAANLVYQGDELRSYSLTLNDTYKQPESYVFTSPEKDETQVQYNNGYQTVPEEPVVTVLPTQVEGNIVKENNQYYQIGSNGEKIEVDASSVEGTKRFYANGSWNEHWSDGMDHAIAPIRAENGSVWKINPQTGDDEYDGDATPDEKLGQIQIKFETAPTIGEKAAPVVMNVERKIEKYYDGQFDIAKKMGMPDDLAGTAANISTGELFFKFIPKIPATSSNLKSADDIAPIVSEETGNASGAVSIVTDAEISSLQRGANVTYSELKQTAEFLKNNGLDISQRREVIKAFNPGAEIVKLDQDLVVYRYYGGAGNPRGRWVTTESLTDPVNQLALPQGSTAENVTTWVIPKGTEVLKGTVAPNFGKSGGASQIYVPDKNVLR